VGSRRRFARRHNLGEYVNVATHITLRQIEYFISVADTGQISRSANLCAVSQSSMTIALKNLEDTVGVPLLQRHARGVRLTRAGERFLRHVQNANVSVGRAVVAAQEEPEQISGHVRVGVTETVSAYLMPSMLATVSQRFEHLTVEVIEDAREDIEQRLVDNQLDIGLMLVSNTANVDELKYETILRKMHNRSRCRTLRRRTTFYSTWTSMSELFASIGENMASHRTCVSRASR
jgi:DNA-binding transcriptional LysR family regulator